MTAQDPRVILFVMVFMTNLVSTVLLSLRNYRNTGEFMRAVMSDRSTTSLIVQLLSSFL